jgi:TolB-like protein
MDRSVVVRFGPFAFDRARMVLEREGQPVPIGGRGAALLAALVDAQGQVLTRNELLDAVWHGQVVEERNLTIQISSLRKAMGDLPAGEDPIRTVSRVGYRLMLDGLAPFSSTILALRPTVAVLPFANLSGDPEFTFFVDGVTEDIIAALSRFQTFAVVARGSSFAYKGRAVPAPEIAQALGVRYILDGSVRRDGRRLRIAAQLCDESGHLHWADCFEEELDGVFEIQDRITETVVSHAEPRIARAELERSRRKQSAHLDAYDHFLRGMVLFNDPNGSAAQYDRMVGDFDRAAEFDPGFPQALAYAGLVHEQRRTLAAASPPGVDDFALATELCARALARAGDDALVLAITALERHTLGDDGEAALALAERALAINPHSCRVLSTTAFILRQRGQADRAIGLYEHRLRLGPNSPQDAMAVENIGCCHLELGRFEEAVAWISRSLAMGANWDLALINLTVAHAMLGQSEEAHEALERFLRVRPGATIQGLMARLPPGVRRSEERTWPEGLRRAGLLEG